MLELGSEMLLLIPTVSNKRVLHPGKVIESDAKGFVAEFEEYLATEIGADVNVYGDVRGKFYQQGARVLEIRQTEPTPVVVFQRVGEAVSAESRQIFRVSVATVGIFATVEKETHCRVVDVSPMGLAVIMAGEYKLGSLVQVAFTCESHSVSMAARVQTVKIRPDGKFRYGLLAPEKNSTARKTLQQISTAVQRTQLRRLAGAA